MAGAVGVLRQRRPAPEEVWVKPIADQACAVQAHRLSVNARKDLCRPLPPKFYPFLGTPELEETADIARCFNRHLGRKRRHAQLRDGVAHRLHGRESHIQWPGLGLCGDAGGMLPIDEAGDALSVTIVDQGGQVCGSAAPLRLATTVSSVPSSSLGHRHRIDQRASQQPPASLPDGCEDHRCDDGRTDRVE